MTRIFLTVAALGAATAAFAQPANVEAAREALRQTDMAYSQAGAAKDIARWASMYSGDATMMPPNATTITGIEGVRRFGDEFTAMPGFMIRFSPARVEVSDSGDMGFTLTTYEVSFTGSDGRPVSDRGRDFHLWKRQPDGSWKLLIDIWNSELPTLPAH